jgi:ketosteroid isomerase-like protein
MSPTQSQSPKQLVLSLYDAFNRGDIATILGSLSADVEWIDEGPAVVPFAGTYRGTAEVGQFFGKLATSTAFDEFVVDASVAEGDRVVVLGHFTARNKANGKSLSTRYAHAWIVRDGKATQFVAYGDTAAVAAIYA